MSASILEPTKNLILYGIGTFCNKIVHIWKTANLELFDSILCFTDSRPETWGSQFHGKPVISPYDIRHQDYHKIIITTEKYSAEILRSLVEQYQIPSNKIVAYPINKAPYEPLFLPNYKLYTENNNLISEYCTRNYNLNKPLDVQVIPKGFILPFEVSDNFYGGVYNENEEFVAGHIRCLPPDPNPAALVFAPRPIPPETICINKTVVYGGILFSSFGHMITESLARLWWYIKNSNIGYQFAFLFQGTISELYYDFLRMLGLTEEKILFIDRPMQFDAIIIPEQAIFLYNGKYHEQAIKAYDTIRDSVIPAHYEKIYLTRGKLPMNSRLINEDYFEEHFRLLGYQVIAPEQLTFKEQVALMAGAKYVACTLGTLSHLILFSKDEVNITLLCRSSLTNQVSSKVVSAQSWINQARKANCTMINVSMNFLTDHHLAPSHLLFPTTYWFRYLQDEGISTTNPPPVYFQTSLLKWPNTSGNGP